MQQEQNQKKQTYKSLPDPGIEPGTSSTAVLRITLWPHFLNKGFFL